MAFKKVSGARKYFKYSECKPGDTLVSAGVYLGVEQGTFGPIYVFKQADGQTVVLNKAAKLAMLLDKYAEPGKSLCNVFYGGMETIKKGAKAGKDAHNFDLEIDDGEGERTAHKSEPAPQSAQVEIPDISL